MTADAMFTDAPSANGISQAERDYNAQFAARLPSIMRRREIAVRGTECEREAFGMRRTVYEGVLITHAGMAWKAERVAAVVWAWGDETINFVNLKNCA